MKNKILAFALIACAFLILVSCSVQPNPETKTDPSGGSNSKKFENTGDIKSFYYSFGSGFSPEPVRRFVVRDLFGKTILEYFEYDKYVGGFPLEVDSSIYDDLISIINENDIYAWDGFDKAAEVTDGYGFDLEIAFENVDLTAHGYMMEPDNYTAGHTALETYFDAILEAHRSDYYDAVNSIAGITVELPKISEEDKDVFNEQPDYPVAPGWHNQVWPHNYDLERAIERGLATEEGFSDNYFEMQTLYRHVLEHCIATSLNLELYETMISVTNIAPKHEKMQSFYMRNSTMGSRYFCLRNNIYIERLDQADIDMLQAAIKDGEAYIFRDIVSLVQRTYWNVICPYEDNTEDSGIYSISPQEEDADNYDIVISLDAGYAITEPIFPVDWTTKEVLDYMEIVFNNHAYAPVRLFRGDF